MHLLALTPGTGFAPEAWARVLTSGVDAFMVRERGLEAGALLAAARWCRAEVPHVAVWVNGRLDVALAAGCGVHTPEAHPPVPGGLAPLSRPLHDPDQWPGRQGADQLLLGPIHPVPGKGAPWGLPGLHAFLDGRPEGGPRLLALGGLGEGNLHDLHHPRLAGIAVIRALWNARDPAEAVARMRDAWGP